MPLFFIKAGAVYKELKMKRLFSLLAVGFLGLVGTANAAANITAPTLSTEDFIVVAGAVIIALATIWVIKKSIDLLDEIRGLYESRVSDSYDEGWSDGYDSAEEAYSREW